MERTTRQHDLDRAAINCLAAAGARWPVPHFVLERDMERAVIPPARHSEITDSIRFMERMGRIHGTNTETGVKWIITDAGRAWKETTD